MVIKAGSPGKHVHEQCRHVLTQLLQRVGHNLFSELHLWCRAQTASAAVASFAALSMHAVALPLQWPRQMRPAQLQDSQQAVNKLTMTYPNYVLMLPACLLFDIPYGERSNTWPVQKALMYVLVLAVLLGSYLYPMDWGKQYQVWPVPTAYACAAGLCATQAAEPIVSLMLQRSARQL